MSRRCAIVLIGRNEGERLAAALDAVAGYDGQVIYVDSESSDGSVELAQQRGADVVELDPAISMSAARGRNAGFERALAVDASLTYVQFVDGDCELDADWIEAALAEMERDESVAVVCGRLRERHPKANAFHRLLEQEWNQPAGKVQSSGGIAMMRVSALQAAGSFDATLKAGEEPELCMRLRAKGFSIVRIENVMAYHDAEMTTLSQWWQRGKRTGHGGLDVYWHTRKSDKLFAGMLRRTLLWTLGWLILLIVLPVVIQLIAGPVFAGVVALGLLVLQPLQWIRLAKKQRPSVSSCPIALHMAALQMIDKWAQLHGMGIWLLKRLTAPRKQMQPSPESSTKPSPDPSCDGVEL